ncbi:hypothetical protein QUF80_15785 [Desulfococcaceae bacterium HSG8]|nr:hypothetical protein [Desulfococcaceae bacterium HSG8]
MPIPGQQGLSARFGLTNPNPAHAGDLSIPREQRGLPVSRTLSARFGLANPNPRTCGGFVNPPRATGEPTEALPALCLGQQDPFRSVRIGKSEARTCGGFVNPPRATGEQRRLCRLSASVSRTPSARFGLANPNPSYKTRASI